MTREGKELAYGRIDQTVVADDVARHAEEVAVKGFTIIPGVFDAQALVTWRRRIDEVYARQEEEFGRAALEAMQEQDVCRAPLLYDLSFVELAAAPEVMAVVRHFLGDWFILNLQNAVINRPSLRHHQSSWHRDLPHQNFVISRPLAINGLIAIDTFSAETGGTQVLPFSHKNERLPSDDYIRNNLQTVAAEAGSVIVFDAMLYHRAGSNTSGAVRRAVNLLYTAPIIKQQYDLPRALGDQPDLAPPLRQLLGYTSQVPLDDRSWRRARAARIKESKTA
jgi:ectoine hydroxylase-related dioxygenase (phytanoyl-CoA dioxygenase family)